MIGVAPSDLEAVWPLRAMKSAPFALAILSQICYHDTVSDFSDSSLPLEMKTIC